MALAYGPVQWTRLATLRRAPSVLDQWFTLPIFAWVPVWCRAITHGWSARYALIAEVCSLASYALALLHERGFELALGAHIAAALLQAAAAQRTAGDAVSLRYFIQAALVCRIRAFKAPGPRAGQILALPKSHWTLLVQSVRYTAVPLQLLLSDAPYAKCAQTCL
ncbi:hypothetical protein HF521_009063, partial [Silurus meridionalis]